MNLLWSVLILLSYAIFCTCQPTTLPSKRLYTSYPAIQQDLQKINGKLDTLISQSSCDKNAQHPTWSYEELLQQAKRKYKLFSQSKTWEKARAQCQFHGGDLATIKSFESITLISIMARAYVKETGQGLPHHHFWTSGYEFPVDSNNWYWANDNSSLSANSTFWAPTQPDNHGGVENCVDIIETIVNFLLNDNNCAAELPFICEF